MLDLERREPVWKALATLFGDGYLDETGVRAIAQTLKNSRYSAVQLREIYSVEVAPVCYEHLVQLGSGGFCYLGAYTVPRELEYIRCAADSRWLSRAIIEYLDRCQARAGWWPFRSISSHLGVAMTRREWARVMQVFVQLRNDPWTLTDTLQTCSDIPTLVHTLENLALLEEDAAPALAHIARLLNHPDFRVRAAAIDTAAQVLKARAVGAVVALLQDPSPSVKSAAIAALHRILDSLEEPRQNGTNGSLLPSPNAPLFEHICHHALANICSHLSDGKSADRLHAARVIAHLGVPARHAQATLIAGFGDRNEAVRRAIADAFVALKLPAEPTLCVLRRAIFDESARVRQTAALCLGRLLASGDQRYYSALYALESALNDSSKAVCEGAAAALGWMGSAAAAAVPKLARLARAPHPSTRATALFALGQMREASLGELPTMAAALKDPHPEVRRAALRAFARLGPMASPLTPQFEVCLHDTDWLTQFEARRTLEAVQISNVSLIK